MIRARLPAAAAAATIGSLALAGCGSLATPPKGIDPVRPYRIPQKVEPISPQEIAATPPASPQRTVLRWFRALQVRDFRTAQSLFAPDARPTIAELRSARRAAVPLFLAASFDRVVDVDRDGAYAIAFARLVRNLRAPNGQDDRYTLPQGFRLRLVGGRWLIADDLWLAQLEAAKQLGTQLGAPTR